MELLKTANLELWALLFALVLGLAQVVAGGERVAVARENFNRSFPLFAASVLALAQLDGFGGWSAKGALVYAVARAAYLAVEVLNWTAVRKWIWAASIAGIVGCYAQLAKRLIELGS